MIAVALHAETCTLLSFKAGKTPVVRRNIVYYSTDLTFDIAPSQYWVHYDEKKEAIVIDCYGDACFYPFKGIPAHLLFKSLTMRLLKTPLSPNGQQSTIEIGTERGWKSKGLTVNSTTIRLVVWQEMNQVMAPAKKKK